MAAERDRCVILMGLEVTDDASYARYRTSMKPILESHGGAFGCDFIVAKVLKGPSERLNRVFTLLFPDRAARERFFADPGYREVRAKHFEPAVARAIVLADPGDGGCSARGTKATRGSNFGSGFSRTRRQ